MDARGGKLVFEFDRLIRSEARENDFWVDAPLHFTTVFYSPEALDAAFRHWCFLNGRIGFTV